MGRFKALFFIFEVPLNGDDCTAQLPVQRSQVFQSFASWPKSDNLSRPHNTQLCQIQCLWIYCNSETDDEINGHSCTRRLSHVCRSQTPVSWTQENVVLWASIIKCSLRLHTKYCGRKWHTAVGRTSDLSLTDMVRRISQSRLKNILSN